MAQQIKDRFTLKKQAFVSAYLANGFNATKAAVAAGFAERSASSQGARLLNDVDVAREIAQHMEKIETENLITADRILKEYARLAFFDPRSLYNEDGAPKKITELDADAAASISSVKIVSFGKRGQIGLEQNGGEQGGNKQSGGEVIEYRFAAKNAALDSLARIKGMFNDKFNLGDESIRALFDLIAGSGSDILSRVRRDTD